MYCGERSVMQCGVWTELPLWEHDAMSEYGMFGLQEEVVHNSRGTLSNKPDPSTVSAEMFAPTKAVQFTPVDELVEAETGRKWKRRRSSLVQLLHRSRKNSSDDEVEQLEQVKFLELLALNLPDWYLVLLGVICAALLGALFPFMAVVFSGLLDVSMHSICCAFIKKYPTQVKSLKKTNE